jgi:hypothetical protein
MYETMGERHLLNRLEEQQEQLHMVAAMVDSHAQEFSLALQRKRLHLSNIASLTRDVGLMQQCCAEMEELYSGAEYRRAIAHIEQYQTMLSNKQQSLAAEIDNLRYQISAADSSAGG